MDTNNREQINNMEIDNVLDVDNVLNVENVLEIEYWAVMTTTTNDNYNSIWFAEKPVGLL